MGTKEVLDCLWAMYQESYAKPTHFLLDPSLVNQLQRDGNWPGYPIRVDMTNGNVTVFGLPVLPVLGRNYPFLAIGHIVIAEETVKDKR